MNNEILTGAAGDFIGSLLADFVAGVISATHRRVRKQLLAEPQRKALVESFGEALTLALQTVTIETELNEHYKAVFSDFLTREQVQDELSILLNPHAGILPNVQLLKKEFADAGYDHEFLGELDFDVFILTFADRFYVSAAARPELHTVIEISLLRSLVAQLELTVEQLRTIGESNKLVREDTSEIADIVGQINKTVSEYLEQKDQAAEKRVFEILHLVLKRTIARLDYLMYWLGQQVDPNADIDLLEPIPIPNRLITSAVGLWEKWKTEEITQRLTLSFIIKLETALAVADAVFMILNNQRFIIPAIHPDEQVYHTLIHLRDNAREQLYPIFEHVHSKLGQSNDSVKGEITDALLEMVQADEKLKSFVEKIQNEDESEPDDSFGVTPPRRQRGD